MHDNPDVARRVREELDAVYAAAGDAASMAVMDPNLVSSCTYLECAIKETLRYHAPVPRVARKPVHDILLGGKYAIPKGTIVLVGPWIVHHHPGLWKNAEEFEPLR
jgi:cytochrome P450